MGLDQLLELTSSVASKALPILGFIVFIFLILFIKHLITLLKSANEAVTSMKQTLDTTNRQLETLDKPLNTLNELSDTVDYVHDASKQAVQSTFVMVLENFSSIKDWILTNLKKDKGNTNEKESGSENDGQ